MTLAQRLGELATANEQGLLECVTRFHFFSKRTLSLTNTGCSDDEYRLLRANLFERFANVSTVPSEAPIVRLSVSAHQSPPSLQCPPYFEWLLMLNWLQARIYPHLLATRGRIPFIPKRQ